jgi:hypothetical protein
MACPGRKETRKVFGGVAVGKRKGRAPPFSHRQDPSIIIRSLFDSGTVKFGIIGCLLHLLDVYCGIMLCFNKSGVDGGKERE